jgi:hypothetical protein
MLAVEVGREGHKEVDIAVAGEPGVSGGRADLEEFSVDGEVSDGGFGAFGEGGDGLPEPAALLLGGDDPLADRRRHRREVVPGHVLGVGRGA